MDDDLAGFLAPLTPTDKGVTVWGGSSQLQVASYLTERLPPPRYVTSARAVMVREIQVMTVRGPDDIHILPGGRIEPGETPEDAVRREVLEEVGWSLQGVFFLGIVHYHHLTPRPDDHPYPYPDFLQTIYAGRPDQYLPQSMEPDEFVLDSAFRSLEEVRALDLTAGEQAFLNEALRVLSGDD